MESSGALIACITFDTYLQWTFLGLWAGTGSYLTSLFPETTLAKTYA